MAREKATIEKVRKAFFDLQTNGEAPSATRIMKITGGSKTTVLQHMRTILTELATSSKTFDPSRGMLELAAETMTKKLWEEARKISQRSFETRLQALVTLQTGLFEELRLSAAAEEAAEERAKQAEQRLLALESQLAELKTQDGQLRAVAQLLRIVPTARRLPSEQMLHLLRDGEAVDKTFVYQNMIAIGYTDVQFRSARSHCLDYQYMLEIKLGRRTQFRIMPKGIEHLGASELKLDRNDRPSSFDMDLSREAD